MVHTDVILPHLNITAADGQAIEGAWGPFH